jgi:uncharacterized membrane protein
MPSLQHPRVRRPLASALLATLIAACGDADAPTSPALDGPLPGPVFTVATFGVTQIGNSVDQYVANAINDDALVAGGARSNVVSGQFVPSSAFLWSNGAAQLLPRASFFETSVARDVNGPGLVVGSAGSDATAWEGGTITRLARVYPNGTGVGAFASSVNDAGQIVGMDRASGSPSVGVYWSGQADPNPTVLPLAVSGPDAFGNPLNISNAGLIVGQATTTEAAADAVVWTSPAATATPLRGFGGARCGDWANAVNELGEIVGACELNGSRRAVYWPSKDADPVDLGEGNAWSINDLGQIGGTDGVRPFLWNPEAGTFRRYDLGVPDASVPIATGVTDLNNTGEATGFGNASITFLWTIPIRARIDVVPGVAANTVKRDGRGTVTVAILGSRWFRATDVNPATLTLGNDDGVETPVARRSSGVNTKLADINKDGLKDLIAEFDKRQLMNNGDLPLDAPTLVLLGRMGDGGHIRGVDAVQVTK